jgi:hypothetical protein
VSPRRARRARLISITGYLLWCELREVGAPPGDLHGCPNQRSAPGRRKSAGTKGAQGSAKTRPAVADRPPGLLRKTFRLSKASLARTTAGATLSAPRALSAGTFDRSSVCWEGFVLGAGCRPFGRLCGPSTLPLPSRLAKGRGRRRAAEPTAARQHANGSIRPEVSPSGKTSRWTRYGAILPGLSAELRSYQGSEGAASRVRHRYEHFSGSDRFDFSSRDDLDEVPQRCLDARVFRTTGGLQILV